MTEEGFRGLTFNELREWKPPVIKTVIGNNILPAIGAMAIYGSEHTWKSMLAVDMMAKIATGQPWFGHPTKINPVYYFQSEIHQHLLQERTNKYMDNNPYPQEGAWLSSDLYEKIDKGWGSGQIEKEMMRTRSRVLVIDPLNNSTSANLVDDYAVGQMIDTFNRWRKTFNCAIVLIHHNRQSEHKEGETYHYGTEEMFGTRIKKWVDTQVYVELTNDGDPVVDLRLTFEKVRHAHRKIHPINIQVSRDDLVFKLRQDSSYVI